MKLALCCAAVLLLCVVGVFAADHPVAGTWDWTATPDEGDQAEGTLEVKALDGGNLEAVLVTHEGNRITTVDPKLDGNQFSFKVTIEDNTYAVTVTIDGNKFAGKFTGENSKGKIEGTRKG